MKKWVICLFIVAVLGFVLLGCIPQVTPVTPPPQPDEDDGVFWTLGYTKGSVTTKEIYKDFLGAFYNPLKNSSTSIISATVPYINMEYNFEARVNEIDFTINFKRYYNFNAPDTQSMMFSFWKKTETANIASMYYFAGEENDKLYFRIGSKPNDTRIMVPIAKENIFRFSPQTQQDPSEWLSGVLNNLLQVGEPKYEYKRTGSTYNRHYQFDIDFQKTLVNILDFAEDSQDIPVGSVEFLIENLLGVSAEDVRADNIPEISARLEFWTANGEDNFGAGVLQSCTADVKMYDKEDSTKCKQTVFEIKKFSVLNTSKNNMPEEDFSKYDDFFTTAYRIHADIEQEGRPLDLQIDFRVSSDQYVGKMYGFARNKTTEEKEMEMSYEDGLFRMKLYVQNKKVEFELPMDLGKVVGSVASDFYYKEEKAELIKVLTYLIGNFDAYSSSEFSLKLNRWFFEDILMVSQEEFLRIMQENTSEGVDVEKVLLDAGWTIEGARDYIFTLFMNLNEVHKLISPIKGNDVTVPVAFEN